MKAYIDRVQEKHSASDEKALLAHPCRFCKAKPGEPCKTPGGEARGAHKNFRATRRTVK